MQRRDHQDLFSNATKPTVLEHLNSFSARAVFFSPVGRVGILEGTDWEGRVCWQKREPVKALYFIGDLLNSVLEHLNSFSARTVFDILPEDARNTIASWRCTSHFSHFSGQEHADVGSARKI